MEFKDKIIFTVREVVKFIRKYDGVDIGNELYGNLNI